MANTGKVFANISIHALREEGDVLPEQTRRHKEISIHALREEGDSAVSATTINELNFYPRPPRGGRHFLYQHQRCRPRFLSTPSARRATHTT